MHRIIVTLDKTMTEDELFEMMPKAVDDVTDKTPTHLVEAEGFLSNFGEVKDGLFTPDLERIKVTLVGKFERYKAVEINSLEDFIDTQKNWEARSALNDPLEAYVCEDGWLMTYTEWLREIYVTKNTLPSKITGVFDYHF